MKIKKRLALLSSLLIITFLVYNSSANAQGLTSHQIDSLVAKSMELMPQQAGLAIVVVKDGKVIHSKGYGVTSIESKEAVDENTLFAIASNTKAFTAATLAILVDEGKLSWQDKVVDYIPEFKMYDPYVTANFSIQDLLTHRSGLGLGAGDLLFWPGGTDFTVDDIINSFQYQKPVSAFRTKYDYDNLLYMVAGVVVARISGVSWTEFVQDRIMKPLGMNRSAGIHQNIKDKSNIAKPHTFVNGKLKELEAFDDPNGILSSFGGIYSSVNDMSKWILMHLNGGKYGEDLKYQLFSEASQKEMWKSHSNMKFNFNPDGRYNNHFMSYGLGWQIEDLNGYVVMSHGGGLPGMGSSKFLVPELNMGVVVLTNATLGGNSMAFAKAILDSYLGVEKREWINDASKWYEYDVNPSADKVLASVWETVENSNSDHLVLENFTGTYKDNWFGKVEIYFKDHKLWFKPLRSPKLNGQMFYYKENTFVIKMEYTYMQCDAFATFTLDSEGKATAIEMKGVSPYIDFSFDYHDLDLKRVADKK